MQKKLRNVLLENSFSSGRTIVRSLHIFTYLLTNLFSGANSFLRSLQFFVSEGNLLTLWNAIVYYRVYNDQPPVCTLSHIIQFDVPHRIL